MTTYSHVAPRVAFCDCENPIMDVEHDAGCRRCGLPVDFSPTAPRVVVTGSGKHYHADGNRTGPISSLAPDTLVPLTICGARIVVGYVSDDQGVTCPKCLRGC